VLEGVTLAEMVEFVVEVLVDLAGGAVLDEKAAEDSETSHPENLAIIHSISTVIQTESDFQKTSKPKYIRLK
jgi:hypothetical protein